MMLNIRVFKYELRLYPGMVPKYLNPFDGTLTQEAGSENLPLPQVDVIGLEREFLVAHGEKRAMKELADEADFDAAFKRYADWHGLMDRWHAFEGERLTQAAVEWCLTNDIRYCDQE